MKTAMPVDEEERKNRRNAIITYDRVDDLATSVARMETKLDGVAETLKEVREVHVDHELRIRALELSNAGAIAASARGVSIWNWVWGAVISLPTLLVAYLTYLKM